MSVIKLDNERYFSTTDGVVISKADGERLMREAALRQRNLLLHNKVQVVRKVDRQVIHLGLAERNKTISPPNGFLVTVFLNDPRGLIQLYNTPVIDPASGVTLRSTLKEYIDIEVDVDAV